MKREVIAPSPHRGRPGCPCQPCFCPTFLMRSPPGLSDCCCHTHTSFQAPERTQLLPVSASFYLLFPLPEMLFPLLSTWHPGQPVVSLYLPQPVDCLHLCSPLQPPLTFTLAWRGGSGFTSFIGRKTDALWRESQDPENLRPDISPFSVSLRDPLPGAPRVI